MFVWTFWINFRVWWWWHHPCFSIRRLVSFQGWHHVPRRRYIPCPYLLLDLRQWDSPVGKGQWGLCKSMYWADVSVLNESGPSIHLVFRPYPHFRSTTKLQFSSRKISIGHNLSYPTISQQQTQEKTSMCCTNTWRSRHWLHLSSNPG